MRSQEGDSMNTKQYQQEIRNLDCHESFNRTFAHALGLCEEAGEVAGKLCKAHRKKEPPNLDELKLELGDVLWRVGALCNQLDVSMDEIMELNIEKLHDRLRRGVLVGSGDNR